MPVDHIGAAIAQVGGQTGARFHRLINHHSICLMVPQGNDNSVIITIPDKWNAASDLGSQGHQNYLPPRQFLVRLEFFQVGETDKFFQVGPTETLGRGKIRPLKVKTGNGL